MKIAVAGVGYVGLAQAVLLAQRHSVKAITTTPAKAEKINSGISPIVDKEISEYMKKRERLTAVCAGLLIVMYCAFCHVYFWGHYKDKIGVDPSEELVSFLDEHDLHYGYASFWNASVNSVLSSGKVIVLPTRDYDAENGKRKAYNPSDYRHWLLNDRWYDPATHPGKCFVLLKNYAENDEKSREQWIKDHGDDPDNPWIDPTPPEDVCEEFYTLNPQKLECGDYTILVFEDNEELRALGDEIKRAK